MTAKRRGLDNVDPTGEFPTSTAAYFFYLMNQVARRRDLQDERRLAPTGLNPQQVRNLAIIRRIESCSMSDLAHFSAADRTTLTRMVDQLVADGLVERWSSPKDRRRVNLSLTDRGEAVYIQAAAVLVKGNEAALASLDDQVVRAATRLLREILENLVEDPTAAAKLAAYGATPSAR